MVFYHTHLHNETDMLYQMMRISFNYHSWSLYDCENMRDTHLWGDPTIIKKIEDYHNAVENMEEFKEGFYSVDEARGDVVIKKKKDKKTRKIEFLGEITDDKVEVEVVNYKIKSNTHTKKWKQIEEDYKDETGICLSGRSDPRYKTHINEKGFIKNLALGKAKSSNPSLKKDIKLTIDNLSWHSLSAISEGKYVYVKLFIGYDTLDNPNNYNVYMRTVTLSNNDTVNRCVKKYVTK